MATVADVNYSPQRIARLGIDGPPCAVTDIAEILIPAHSNGVRAVPGNRCAAQREPLRWDSTIAASHSSVA